jgi:hypothetical protein
MKHKFLIKNNEKFWPTVLWQGTSIVTYYIDDLSDDVKIRESRGIDFDELLLHIDRGGSIFLTTQEKDKIIFENQDPKEPVLPVNKNHS